VVFFGPFLGYTKHIGRIRSHNDLRDADRDIAVLQKLYDVAEVKSTLALSLMEEDS
jgi:hypothetical protein